MGSDHFCLRWNNFQSNIVSALESLKTEEDLVDVTLACEGQSVKAHKVILSACSPYFRNVFKENPCQHPVVILKDVSYDDVAALLSFMYQGEVYITQDRLASFLHTAELLQIRGLTGATSPFRDGQQQQQQPIVKQQPHSSSRQPSPTPIAQSAPNANSSGQQSTTFSQLPASSSSTSYPPSSTSYSASSSVSSPKRKKAIPRRVSTSYSVPPQSTGEEKLISEPSEPNDQAGTKIVNLTTKQEPPDIDEEMEDEATLSNYEGSERDQGEERDETRLSSEEIDAPEHEGKSPPSHEDSTTSSMLAKSLTSFRPMDSQGIYSSSMPPTFGQPGSPELSSDRFQCRPCPLCHKIISNKSNLQKHLKIRHSAVCTQEMCGYCGKVFKNKYSLGAHVYMYHKQQGSVQNIV